MSDILNTFHYIPSTLTIIGLIITGAFLGSKIFQRFGIPQVVGFIAMGAIAGPSFLNIVPLELTGQLDFISEIALGLIGFDIGSHLLLKDLRRLGRSIAFILLFEALGTFVLVTAGVYALTGVLHVALVFGALSTATAPAATVDVLAEYDAKGPLTTSLLAVVGLDDALALMLFSVAATVAEAMLVETHALSVTTAVILPLVEIGGSVLLGLGIGLLLNYIMRHMKRQHDAMAVCIGFVFLSVGLANSLGFSLILTAMVVGIVVMNLNEAHGRNIRYTIEQAGPVIYVLFFALIGARFQIRLLPTMGLLGIAYVVLRSAGKFAGAWLGGTLGGAEPAVRDNLGLGLLSQAGVAIGLALESAHRFGDCGEPGIALCDLVITVITATTFVVQMIGPLFVKVAISRAGEIGKAVEEHNGWASEGAPD